MNLLETVKKITGIDTYDASNSEVIVANYPLSDFTKVTITTTEMNKFEIGIDPNYQVPISTVPTTTISVSLLANSDDVYFMEKLQDYLQSNGGYFNISIVSSGKFKGSYSCFFLKTSDINIDIDPEDEVFEFGAVREDRGASARPLFRTTQTNI